MSDTDPEDEQTHRNEEPEKSPAKDNHPAHPASSGDGDSSHKPVSRPPIPGEPIHLYIRNINDQVRAHDLENLFKPFVKQLIRCKLMRGHAFFDFEPVSGITISDVIDKTINQTVRGAKIAVEVSNRVPKHVAERTTAAPVPASRPAASHNPPKGYPVYMIPLEDGVKEDTVRRFFEQVPDTTIVELQTRYSKKHAVVSFETQHQADCVVQALNGKSVMGKEVKVSLIAPSPTAAVTNDRNTNDRDRDDRKKREERDRDYKDSREKRQRSASPRREKSRRRKDEDDNKPRMRFNPPRLVRVR
eukprot:PhF_6_TR2190/c0_g1_i3/m.3619